METLSETCDWIVNDSEDETVNDVPTVKPPGQTSSISEYTPRVVNKSTLGYSTISTFTPDSPKNVEPDYSGSSFKKTTRPRPRPAYKSAGLDPIPSTSCPPARSSKFRDQSNSAQAGNYMQDIAERAKTRVRSPASRGNGSSTYTQPEPQAKENTSKNIKAKAPLEASIIIDLSSDEEHVSFSRLSANPTSSTHPHRETLFPATATSTEISFPGTSQNVPYLDNIRSVLSPSDPPTLSASGHVIIPPFNPPLDEVILASTPPSSPFALSRKPKRKRVVHDDDDCEGTMQSAGPKGDMDTSQSVCRALKNTAITKPKPAKKPRERREKKSKEKTKYAAPTSQDSTSQASRPNLQDAEPTFKSREFIDDSDDDLALVCPSVRPSMLASVPTSAPISMVASLPSISASVPPTVPQPAPPSAYPLLPPKPSVVITSRPRPKLITQAEPIINPDHMLETAPHDHAERHEKQVKSKKDAGLKDKRLANGDRTAAEPPKHLMADTDIANESQAARPKPGKRPKRRHPLLMSDDEGIPTTWMERDVALRHQIQEEARKETTVDREFGYDGRLGSDNISRHKESPLDVEVDKENRLRPKSHPPAPTLPPVAKSKTMIAHTVPRKGSLTDLIKRVNSRADSPLVSPAPARYSPFAKASRSALMRIAPLHPNRRTPPPAPPRPPAPKKSKKMLEMEERWVMELSESVDGWVCLSDEERAGLLRAKRDMELGCED